MNIFVVINNDYYFFLISFVLSFILLAIGSRINKMRISFFNCIKISLLSSIVSIIMYKLYSYLNLNTSEKILSSIN